MRDERLAKVFDDLLDTLRDFVRRHDINHSEYRKVVEFLHEAGQVGEMPLLLDVFLESTIEDVSFGARPGTTSTIEGPYYLPDAPVLQSPAVLPQRAGEPGDPLIFSGVVRDDRGDPLPEATLDMWQADAEGKYSGFAPDVPDYNLRGRITPGNDGSFEIRTIKPAPYEIPKAGPTGRLLVATGRHAWRPAHLHLKVSAPGCELLTTQLYFAGGDYVEEDCANAVKAPLVTRPELRSDPQDYQDLGLDTPYHHLAYDITLARSR